MPCLDENTLFELALGRIEGEALNDVEGHLDSCASCRKALATALRKGGAPATSVAPGTSVGRYLVIERVGAGAIGQVLSAYDPQLDRKVALKLLRPATSNDEQRARLAREAQTLARLSHPNVVTVFDVGEWEAQLFLALEFVADGSARDWVRRQPRTWRETVQVYVQAGRGLAAAHQAGVIHRDFKPDNILVRADGRAQVTDFGLAAEIAEVQPSIPVGADLTEPALTGTGALLGTPAYMAPDQLEGAAATVASDQFSFCVALFEALTGQRPFTGASIPELVSAARKGQVRAAVLPGAVRRVLMRGLSGKPQERFASMAALVNALDSAATRTRRVGLLAAAAVALVLPLGIFVAARRAPGSGAEVKLHSTCALARERHAAVWNEQRRTGLEQVFGASAAPWAKPTLAWVVSALDQRNSAWQDQSDEACEAAVAEPTQTLWSARLACLEDRWAELEATLAVLGTGGPDVVDRASRIVDRLPAPGVCLQTSAANPRHEAQAQALAARAAALMDLGRHAQAEELSRAVEGTERPQVLLQHARALQELGKLDDSQRELFEAGLQATRSGDLSLTASAWAQLGSLIGYARSMPAEGELWARQAEALASSLGDRVLEEKIAAVRGNIETRRGRFAEAERFFVVAERLTRERLGEKAPARARALTNLANAIIAQRRTDEGLKRVEEAHAVLAEVLGSEHPDALQVLNSWAVALGTSGHLEEATGVFRKVLDGYRKSLPPNHPRIAVAALNLAEAYTRAHRAPAEAIASYTLAIEVWTAALGADAPLLASAWGGLGQVQLDTGSTALALQSLQKAVRICEKSACEPMDEATARFTLAKALKAGGSPWPTFEPQARRALALFADLKDAAKDERGQVETWLAAKGK